MDILFLEEIVFWHWWAAAVLLMCIELFAPAAFFIWCGIAAVIVGIALLVMPEMSWQIQFILFSILSVAAVIVGRSYLRKRGVMDTDQPNLNQRGQQYVGREFTLETAIVNGTGRVNVDDGSWRIEGSNMEAGRKIRVTSVNGSTLKVEPVEA